MSRERIQRRMLLGVIILIVGVLSLLDNLQLFDAHLALHFWPMVLMAFGALKIIQTRTGSGYLVGGGMVLAGVLLTLQNFNLITFRWRDWWPAVLILVGLAVIFKDRLNRRVGQAYDAPMADGQSRLDVVAVMSGNNMKMDGQDFRGAEITAVMGGVDLDLRRATMTANEARIHLFAVWGGITVKVPNDWSVVVEGVIPILGGIDDKTVPPATPQKRLFIDGYVLMGGAEILN
jgi:predicted membrane protein